MSGNVTLVSTDPQEVVERVLHESVHGKTPAEEAPSGAETAAEEATAPESSEEVEQEESSEATEPAEAGKPSKRSQKIKRLASKLTEAERERDEWREKYEKSQSVRGDQPAPEAAPDAFAYPVAKPKAADFQNPQDFVEALTDWKSEEREYRKTRMAEVQQAQDFRRAMVDDHNTRMTEFRAEHEDFDEVIKDVEMPIRNIPETLALRQALAAAIQENEDGPEVLYYFAKNPQAMDPLADMSPAQAITYIGRIAAKLEKTNSAPQPNALPEKPRPTLIKPVGGTTKVEADRGSMSFRDYRKARYAEKFR